jgi:hypothetical protein
VLLPARNRESGLNKLMPGIEADADSIQNEWRTPFDEGFIKPHFTVYKTIFPLLGVPTNKRTRLFYAIP